MPLPPSPKKALTKPTLTPKAGDPEVIVAHGITFLGSKATLSVGINVKLSERFQGAGISSTLTFDTPIKDIESSLDAATVYLRGRVHEAVQEVMRETLVASQTISQE